MKKILSMLIVSVVAITMSFSTYAFASSTEPTVVNEKIVSQSETMTTVVKEIETTYSDGTIANSTLTTYYPSGRPGISRANSGKAYASKSTAIKKGNSKIGTYTLDAIFSYNSIKVSIMSKAGKLNAALRDDPNYVAQYSYGSSGTGTVDITAKGKVQLKHVNGTKVDSSWVTITCNVNGATD